MMRCPRFRYLAPRSLTEACAMLRDAGPEGMLLAGGTDLVPNLKRRQQTPRTIISLRRVEELRAGGEGESSRRLGATVTLADLARDGRLRERHAALARAAALVATPHLRNVATLGGNLCLDTRCNYYDQTHEWRKSIDYCMKKDGAICWVAPGSDRCWAVSSTDTAPALLALGAQIQLVSAGGERTLPVSALYRDDGIEYLSRRSDEILAGVALPAPRTGERSTYWKLRRRGSFDFPVLSVAAWIRFGRGGVVEEARIVLGGVASRPVLAPAAEKLAGQPLTDDRIEQTAGEVSRVSRPLDNTDFTLGWRKKVTASFVTGALRELRGDDPRTLGPFAGLPPAWTPA